MKYLFIVLSLIFIVTSFSLKAQVRGTVTGENDEPLPFASVYVQGTTNGTTTNMKGEFALQLSPGEYQVVFQYIGYKQKIEKVQVTGQPLRLNVQLIPEAIELSAIEIKANAEDPAYPIIRKAIEKRKYYLEHVESYACDVYIKGNVKILDAPEKIFGQDIGDMEGNLDTTRQGIVYLSESVSKLYFKQPDRYKEVMQSSKVSGNNQGFSFNSAQDMEINLYRNFSQFGRNVISPIAEGAMGYYKYRLHGAFVEEGHLVNKIEVIPKRSEDPVYRGFIYIIQDLWNIHSADLILTGTNTQMPLFDTFNIRQTFVPVQKPDVWRLFSQTFSLRGGILGFIFGANFTAIYKNYDLAPGLDDRFFDNVIMKVEKGANEKDTTYWSEIRPVPLTVEEEKDYYKKDSIRIVRESKPYMDSMDRKDNTFEWGDLLFGYTWQNSWKRRSYSFDSPINTVQFNTVQGFSIRPGIGFTQFFDKERNKRLSLNGHVSYGFSEKELRAAGSFSYRFNPRNFANIRIWGGRDLFQFNELEPISTLLNTSFSLFGRYNYARFFDKKYIKGQYQQEVANGVLLVATSEWAARSPLENHSDYSFFARKKRDYEPNVPENNHLQDSDLGLSEALTVGLSVRLRPGQKYMDYPDRKFILGSKFPDVWLYYRKGIPVADSHVDFDRVSAAITKSDIALGLVGVMRFRVEAGKFINNEKMFFQDYRHFLGNETNLGNSDRYLISFKMMPYYEFSTRDTWFEGHWEHNFKGFLTDKIPGFNKLGFSLVAGANFLYTAEKKDYTELSLGLDGIGIGFARLLRFDVVSSFRNGKYDRTGWLLGMVLPIDEIQF